MDTRTWRRTDPRRKRKNRRRKHREEEHQHQIASNRSSNVLALFFISSSTQSPKIRSSTQSLKIKSSTSTRSPTQITMFFFLLLQLDRLLRRCVLQVLFFFKSDKNRVCKTRFWFLELKSYRLEIYVAKSAHSSNKTRVWKRRFSSSISSFRNSRCYFP